MHNILTMVKRQFSFLFIMVFFLFMALQSQGPEIRFRAQPGTVQIGDTVVLTWNVPGAGAVYLTNAGRVEGEGRMDVRPRKRTTTYTLIAEGPWGIKTAHVTIEVNGGRGEVFPEREKFEHGRTYEIAAPSTVKLLDSFHAVLQDSLGFEVDERYDRRKAKTVFVTKTSKRPELVKKENRRIGSRELAYWVEVPDGGSPDGKYTCEMRTFILYRRRKERRLRPEKDGGIHRESAERLRDGIEADMR